MRKTFRRCALIVLVAAVAIWLASGANGSLTQTQKEITSTDPVTGLEKREWLATFVPGVDFLAAAAAIAGVLAGASFAFRK